MAGDVGTYSVALQNLSNVDAPYTFFQVGVPEMGINENVYYLPYLDFFNNVRGAPESGDVRDAPWASLDSAVNTDGYNITSGYLLDHDANGFTGFSFNVSTYPGLREMHDRQFELLKERLYSAFPEYERIGLLDDGPEGLDRLVDGLTLVWNTFGAIPDILTIPFIPFDFNVVASATAMNRDEFIAHSLGEAEKIRTAILESEEAPGPLLAIAADKPTWDDLYIKALADGGILRSEDQPAPLRDHEYIVSVMSALASGILLGPAGEQLGDEVVRGPNNESGRDLDLLAFFDQLRLWYGHTEGREAPREPNISPTHLNWMPAIPQFGDYNLALSSPTHFESFRIYVPWVPFESRGASLPPDFQIGGFDLVGTVLRKPQLTQFEGFSGGEILVQADIADDLTIESLLYDELSIGDITVDLSRNNATEFYDEFDLTSDLGFTLTVETEVDESSREVTWKIRGVDSVTGELIPDAFTEFGNGRGFVSYSLTPGRWHHPARLGQFPGGRSGGHRSRVHGGAVHGRKRRHVAGQSAFAIHGEFSKRSRIDQLRERSSYRYQARRGI